MLPPPALIQAPPAEVVATLPVQDLLAEDLAYDPDTGRWFVSSVHRREILVRTPAGIWRVFARGRLAGALGLTLDAKRRRLWACSAGLPHAEGLPAGARGRSELVGFDLDTGREVQRVALAGKGHALGDLALGEDGTVFASDGQGGGVYRLDPGAATLKAMVPPGAFRSPQTSAVVPGGLLVPDYSRGLAFLPEGGGAPRWLSVPEGADLRGIDGVARVGRRLYAVQNGGSPTRILALDLDEAFTKVERATELLSLPEATHLLTRDGALFVLADNGWDDFAEDGTLRPGAARRPPRILRVKLP